MGAGGGGTPALQLHTHAGTVSPTGTRYTRRVTPRHQRAHAGMPAPHRAAAPHGRGPAHRRRAHTAPGPSSCRRHGGTHAPEHDAAVGTCGHTRGGSSPVCRAGTAAGGGSAAGLWEVSHHGGDQPGSHHTHVMHTHARTHVHLHTHARMQLHARAHACPCTHARSVLHALSISPNPTLGFPACPVPWGALSALMGLICLSPDPSVTHTAPAPPAPGAPPRLGLPGGAWA